MKRNTIRIYFTEALLMLSAFAFSQNRESIKIARSFVFNEQITQAAACYSQLVDKEPNNVALLTEYAYTLALNGVYEGALMNLDRARLFGILSEKDYFYIVQAFSLMGCDWVVTEYIKQQAIPEWIRPHYEKLLYKYKQVGILSEEDAERNFRRANYLAASGMYFQSIALYEQMLENNSEEYLFHISYSIPLEKVGLRELAAKELETGILLMPDAPQSDEAKQAFNQRLAQLRQPASEMSKPPSEFLKKLNKFHPQTMLYAGGMFSKSYTSFSSRFGVYLSNSFNGALNLGISGNSTSTNVNIGVSAYQRFGNILVTGLGVNEQIGKDRNVFSIVPSLGFSFINAKRNSSWDIFFNIYCSSQKGASNMYGFSIGKSFYFGTR